MFNTKHWLYLGGTWVMAMLCCNSAFGASLTNMVIENGGGKRFTAPDQGTPIFYVVDAEAIPANLTLPQVLIAVSNAFTAWSEATYMEFKFDGLQTFGKPVKTAALGSLNVPAGSPPPPQRVWVQLHNLYTNFANPDQLGTGGNRAAIAERLPTAEWFGGGCVAGNNFLELQAAWVAISHTNAQLNSLSTLEEVLCHNIGLALGLDTNTNDLSSIMYFQTHADGRGAQLGSLDVNVIQQAYPLSGPIPFTFDRSIEIVTTPTNQPALTIQGINQVQLRGYDLLTTNLTLFITNVTTSLGSFTNLNDIVSYKPNDFHESTNVITERLYFRFSDGINQSPYGKLVVRSFRQDSFPAGAGDGVPDYFLSNYFGDPDPSAGANRGATDDFDGDGLTTLEEYISGMNPIAASSAQRITFLPNGLVQWQTKPDELYELESSSSMNDWILVKPVLATNSAANLSVGPTTATQQFYRTVKIR
jgi:hypothetical protein